MGGGGLDLVIVGNFEHKFKIGQLERLSLLCSLYLNSYSKQSYWISYLMSTKCLIAQMSYYSKQSLSYWMSTWMKE